MVGTTYGKPPTARSVDLLGAHLTENVVALDPNGVVADVGPFAPALLGHPDEQLPGRRFDELFDARDRTRVRQARLRAREERPASIVARLADIPDRLVDIRFQRPASHTDAGVAMPTEGVIAVVRDVTASVDLGVAARLLRRITERANNTSDPSVAMREALDDLRVTLGWEHGLVVQVDDDGRCDPSTAYDDLIMQARTHGHAWSASATDADDTDPHGALTIPVVAGSTTTAALVLWTTTARDLPDSFLEIVTEIGRQLGHVTERRNHLDELEAITAELRRSNQELERFAYIASHDLQEPLRKIIGFAELLERRHADQLDEQATTYLGHLVDAAHRQRSLIVDLLAYSRIGRRPLEQQPVDLTEVCRDVAADLSVLADDVDATIDIAELPRVVGDRQRLTELMTNLFSNAIKYRRSDEPPHVTVSGLPTDPGWCEISVADNGIGIDEQYREQVFEVFRRLHPRSAYPGSGIGLAICRRIVEQHGGTIRLEASGAGGTDVRLTLPVDTAQETDDGHTG